MRASPVLLFLLLLFVPANAQEKPEKAEPVEATLTEYTVRIVRSARSGEEPEKSTDQFFDLRAYNIPEQKSEARQLVVLVQGDLEGSQNIPLGVLVIEDEEIFVELEHPIGRLLSTALQPFLEQKVPQDRVEATGSGEDSVSCHPLALDNIPVNYKSAPVETDEKLVAYTIDLAAPPFVHRRSTIETSLKEFSRRFVLQKEDGRLVQATWFHSYERNITGVSSRTATETIEVAEKSRRVLKDPEIVGIRKELRMLEPVVAAMLPGGRDLLRRSKEGRKLKKQLSQYRKDYKENGALKTALPFLENGFGKVLTRVELPEDPEEVARLMLNKKAPNFTLMDLDGNKVTLAKLKGRAVVLNFWAVL